MNILQKLLFSGLFLLALHPLAGMEQGAKPIQALLDDERIVTIPAELHQCWQTIAYMIEDFEGVQAESLPVNRMTFEQYTLIKRYMDPLLQQYPLVNKSGGEQKAAQQLLQKRLQQDLLNKTLSIDELIGFINANDFNDCSFMLNAGIHALAAHTIQTNQNLQNFVNDPQTLAEAHPFLQQLPETLQVLLANALGELSKSFDWLYAQQKPQLQHTFTEVDFYPRCMACSPDDKALAVAEETMGRVKIWDMQTGNCTHTFQTEPKLLTDIPWDQWTCESVYVDHHPHDCTINAIAWSPNNQFLAYSNDTGVLSVWDMRTQKCINLRDKTDNDERLINFFTSLVWTADSAYLLTANHNSTITLWDFRDLNAINYISGTEDSERYQKFHSPDGLSDENLVTILSLNISKNILATFNPNRASIKLIDISDITKLRCIAEIGLKSLQVNLYHDTTTKQFQWSPGGDMLAVATGDGIILIRDINPGISYTFSRWMPETAINSISWAPDSKHITACTGEGSVVIWDVSKESGIHTITQAVADNAQWSPHGAYLALYENFEITAGDDPEITVWSLEPQWKAAFLKEISMDTAYLIMGAHWAYQHNTQLQLPPESPLIAAYEALPEEAQSILTSYLVGVQDEEGRPAKKFKGESPTHP